MGAVEIASLCAALAVVVAVAVTLLLVLLGRDRRMRAQLDAALVDSRAEAAELRDRLAALERDKQRSPRGLAVPAEFLITDAGLDHPGAKRTGVPDRLVLSATVGEPVVRAMAFVHGVRRALSAESRNRIRFAMRQEVRRSRRRRRREMKQAWRQLQVERASGDDSALGQARDTA